MTTPTTAGGAVLPVAGYRLNSGHGNHLRETLDDATKAFLWAGKPAWRELTYRDAAQAEIDALRAENERLTRERDEAVTFKDEFASGWLNCRNREVALEREIATLKAAQDDQARDAGRPTTDKQIEAEFWRQEFPCVDTSHRATVLSLWTQRGFFIKGWKAAIAAPRKRHEHRP
jgi:phage host-nuclease inhibitor protein Gam